VTAITRLKRVVTLKAGGTPSVDDPTMWSDEGIPWVSIGDMTRSRVIHGTDRFLTREGIAAKRLSVGTPGTILFAMYASVGALAVLGVKAAWNQAILGIQPRLGLSESRFISYWLEHLRPDLAPLTRSNTQDNLNAEQVGNLPFPVLPIDRQVTIADYLDGETDRIDALIIKKRRLSEMLGEDLFASVFTEVTGQHASTKRDSGLGWVDEVPEAWRTVPLRYFAELGTGHTPSRTHPEYWVDCSIPWISLFDVGAMRDPFVERTLTTTQQISELGLANSSAVLHPAGTVVLSRTASVGFATIMGQDMAVSQHFVTWTCGEHLLPEYLLYFLRAMRQEWESLQVGTTNVTVFMPDLLAVKMPLPPLAEQKSIVARIRRRTELIQRLMSSLHRQVELLAEHRQALITAAVTGELDIRGAVA
jgi:type I restriction enzyme S subunit